MSDSNTMQVDQPEAGKIDEGLYSRQLYVLGKEAMLKMQNSNVLIIGLKGLGVEIAKNVALAGVKSLTLYDPEPVAIGDLSSQFFLTEQDIGKGRALATSTRLGELNQYTPITVISELAQLDAYQVIVSTTLSLEQNLEINAFTHAHGIKFIVADVKGLFASVFVDFGDAFTVFDQTGEEVHSGIISDIETDGTVTMLGENRHGLEDGDWVKFSEVEGIEALNDGTLYQIEVPGPYAFRIKFDPSLGTYKKGGLYTQVKVPRDFSFEPLAQQLAAPEYLFSDYAKFDRPPQLHLGFQAVQRFLAQHGQLPRPHHESDAAEVVALTRALAAECPGILGGADVDVALVKELAYQARGDVPGVVAFIGGSVAQEVLKACSGKFVPIRQWLYFDSLESLPQADHFPRSQDTCKPLDSRYDGQIAVFGVDFQQAIANLKVFLVGSGAIGCEMLKNWAMMGLASGPRGKIVITDMDSIEKSNLNRQFLFRPKDVGKNKSETAALAVIAMNPELDGKIEARLEKVGPETEHIFDKPFWEQLDFVTNALDNVDARTYVDRRCVFYKKALLESGTLGTKGNTQVIIPNVTESYSSSQDPPEKAIPLCTLRSFPNKIDHTIAWAKSLFQALFADAAENVNLYLSQPNFVEATLKQSGDVKGILETISVYLKERPYSFEECVRWARLEFEKKYNHDIKQLLYNFPKDATTSNGEPFWSGPKRAPDPLVFDINNDDHFHFIVAGAHLFAFVYGLKGAEDADKAFYAKVLSELEVPEFSPLSDLKIQVNDEDPDPNAAAGGIDNDIIQTLTDSLPPPSSLAGYRLNPVEFEKDDDSNHHIEFITAASNLRALNYSIEPADRQKTKFIAGKIIPAIATTTALVTGLVCLELYKVVDGKTDIEQYKNGFVNLALPLFTFSEPIASPQGKYNDRTFDQIWGRFDLYGDITLQQLLDHFKDSEGLEISMLSYGVSLLYASFFGPKKLKDRYPMKMTELIASVSKKEVPSHETTLIFEICADDKEGEDVEVPYVALHLDK